MNSLMGKKNPKTKQKQKTLEYKGSYHLLIAYRIQHPPI